MPWVTRGLRDGLLTSRWPGQSDAYFDGFPSAVGIVGDDPSDPMIDAAVAACPTEAISHTAGGGVQLDRGRCILCGRCVELAPETFIWRPGSAVAAQERSGLIVGDIPETDDAVRAVREALSRRVRRLRRSVHIRHVDTGSDGADEWEVQALTNPVYDIHRLGLFFTASPRHADILLVTGIGAGAMIDPLRLTLEAMPEPTIVVAAGVDAVSGGIIGGGYMDGTGVGNLVDVDVWVPGSPATPFALMHGILLALDRLPGGSS